ncbi:stork-head domain-containing protein knockout [Brevipalpus obovatus]|uniref:stork-head domain-containing protein knockout n=1 Tax=Brevipalpus obovatus TaxID=246614 RepID=UPI003D9EFFEE
MTRSRSLGRNTRMADDSHNVVNTFPLVRKCLAVSFIRNGPCKHCVSLEYVDDEPVYEGIEMASGGGGGDTDSGSKRIETITKNGPSSSNIPTTTTTSNSTGMPSSSSSGDDCSPYASWTPSSSDPDEGVSSNPAKSATLSSSLSSPSSSSESTSVPPSSSSCTCKSGIDDGRSLFTSFIKENYQCFWNQSLVSSVASLTYKGFIVPSTVLMIGSEFGYEIIRTAFARRIIRPPEGYIIASLGDIQVIEMSLVHQTKFTPLSEAILRCIDEHNQRGQSIFWGDVSDYLRREYTQIMPPSNDMVKKTLRALQKQGKLKYSHDNGYSLCRPEDDIPFIDSKGLISPDDIVNRLHGSPTSSSESAYYGSSGAQPESPHLITPTSLNTMNWDFNPCFEQDSASDQLSLRRSASFRLPNGKNRDSGENDGKRPLFVRSRSLRLMPHRGSGHNKSATMEAEEIVVRNEATKKTSIFSKLFSRLSSSNNGNAKAKSSDYPSLADVLRRSQETETEPLIVETKSCQTQIKGNSVAISGRRSGKSCKSCQCTGRTSDNGGNCSRSCSSSICCDSSRKWPALRSSCTEYCTIIPTYTTTTIGPIDPGCDKCLKMIPSNPSYGCCPLAPAALTECANNNGTSNGLQNSTLIYQPINSLCSHQPNSVHHMEHHATTPHTTTTATNNNYKAHEILPSQELSYQSHGADHMNGSLYKPYAIKATGSSSIYGDESGYSVYDFGPSRPKTKESYSIMSGQENPIRSPPPPPPLMSPINKLPNSVNGSDEYYLQPVDSNSGPSKQNSYFGDTSYRNRLDGGGRSDSSSRNSMSKMTDDHLRTSVQSPIEASTPAIDANEGGPSNLSIGNSMNIKIEIDSSIQNRYQQLPMASGDSDSNHTSYLTGDMGDSSSSIGGGSSLSGTFNRLNFNPSSSGHIKTLTDIDEQLSDQQQQQQTTSATARTETSITTNVTSSGTLSTSSVNICSITRTTSSSTDHLPTIITSSPSANGHPKSYGSQFTGSTSLIIGDEASSIALNEVRQKVARAKAAFFNISEQPTSIDTASSSK